MIKHEFSDVLEASAFTVLLTQMAGPDYLDSVENIDDKYFVNLKKPLPSPLDAVLIAAIKEDQRKNPKKWADAKADLEAKKNDREGEHEPPADMP